MSEGTQLIRGLEGVVAAETRLCDLDGKNGRLAYGGYDIDELARKATFEEVCYLLWEGELPDRAALDRFSAELVAVRAIPDGAGRGLQRSCRATPIPCGYSRPRSPSSAWTIPTPPTTRARRTGGRRRGSPARSPPRSAPTTGSGAARRRCRPIPSLPLAANFLYMLTGKRPAEVVTRAFDACLVLYAEHELNASTFTTRVIAATLSDMHSAVAGGVGALKGTLHGGAGEAVMRTLIEIGRVDNVDAGRTRRWPRSGGSWASAIASTRRAIRARPSCAAWRRRRAASPARRCGSTWR